MSRVSGSTRPAPAPRAPEQVRNVAVVGALGAGKTTLVEALLSRAGAISGAGSAVCDGAGMEVSLALAPLEYAGVKVNLLDTPGGADFVGELRAGLRAADSALFVISAVDGVDPLTTQLWHECAAVGLPRAIVVSQLDHDRADFDDTVAICQRVLGEDVHPLYLPMHADDESVAGMIGLLSQRVYDWSSGDRVERDPDPQHLPLIESLRSELLEGVIAESEDETLLDRYLAGEPLDPQVVARDLERAVASGQFHPVIPAAPLSLLGTDEVLELLTRAMPSPLQHPCPVVTRPDGSPAAPLTCDPAGPLVAEVLQTWTDPDLGRICLVRVFSGTLQSDLPVQVSGHTSGHDLEERSGLLFTPLGTVLRPQSEGRAGDLVCVSGLTRAATTDTLSSLDDPLLLAPWELPEPQHAQAVQAASPLDEERLAAALAQLVAHDLTLRLERHPETGQLLVWTLGEAHAQVLLDRLERLGVAVSTPPVQVPLRETPAGGQLQEPVSLVQVRVPAGYVGTVMSDLSGRRARVTGSEVVDEVAVVTAEVPDRELLAYASALRSLAHGTGSFTRRYLRHQVVQ